MPVSYEEIEAPKFSIDGLSGKHQATRVFRIATWTDLPDFLDELLGTSDAAGTGYIRNTSARFPTPGFQHLWVTNIQTEGFTNDLVREVDSDGVTWDSQGHKVTVTYSTLEFDIDNDGLAVAELPDLPEAPDDTYITVNRTLGMDTLSVPNEGLQWVLPNGSLPAAQQKSIGVNVSISQPIPVETMKVTFHHVTNPNWDKIDELRGKVNDATFIGHAAETVLFAGLTDKRQYQIDGTRRWELDFAFVVKEFQESYDADGDPATDDVSVTVTHNHFFRPNPGTNDPHWQRVVKKNNRDVIELGDFNGLFEPPPEEP